MIDLCVIGAGPAGLMTAQTAVERGMSVMVVDAKPSFGRKFLMAGKSGLNLTKDEPFDKFIDAYGEAADWLRPMVSDLDGTDVSEWAEKLGQAVFTGSSGRVFPKSMKASPLLRAWLTQLSDAGVQFKQKWQWTGWQDDALSFSTPDGAQTITAKTTVLALGGASWARLGSDGKWAKILQERGISMAPFKPANMGFFVDWSPYMAPHFGAPVKSVRFTAGAFSALGECVVSERGLEGSAIYAASRYMREGAQLVLDLLPDQKSAVLANRIDKLPTKASRATLIRKGLRLDGVKAALLNEFAKGVAHKDLVHFAKALPVIHAGPRPMDEAISTAGGVPRSALNDALMLKDLPSVFCAGEMLDWEAPTGGYLITACLATGKTAGTSAADYVASLSGA